MKKLSENFSAEMEYVYRNDHLQRDRRQLLHVARVVALDVLRQVALVPEPLEAGLEQAAERFFACRQKNVFF
jgi:hypothetical protein